MALVVAVAPDDMEDKVALRPQAAAVADPSGVFRFKDVPAGLYLLTATAQGWSQGELADVSLLGGETIENLQIRLSRGRGRLHGRLFDAGGGPIPGATVRALALGAAGRPDGARTFLAAAASTVGIKWSC